MDDDVCELLRDLRLHLHTSSPNTGSSYSSDSIQISDRRLVKVVQLLKMSAASSLRQLYVY